MSGVLYMLSKYPEYSQPLWEELSQSQAKYGLSRRYEHTPLLDSFLKETARLYPLQTGRLCILCV